MQTNCNTRSFPGTHCPWGSKRPDGAFGCLCPRAPQREKSSLILTPSTCISPGFCRAWDVQPCSRLLHFPLVPSSAHFRGAQRFLLRRTSAPLILRHQPATGQGEGGHLCCHKLGSSTKTECRILSTKRSVSKVTRKQLWFIEIKR